MSYVTESQVTQGLVPSPGVTTPSFAGIVSDGVATSAPTTAPTPGPTDSAYPFKNIDTTAMSALGDQQTLQTLQSLTSPVTVRDAQGRIAITNPLSRIDLGGGQTLIFDPTTLDAQVVPNLDPRAGSNNVLYDDSGDSTFTASDCRIMVEIPENPTISGSQAQFRVAKQLLEATTLSVSIHRSKSPVRAFGYANPKGIARGSRTIAGTLVMTKSTAEVLYRFLQAGLVADLTQDTYYTKLDQLPPMDLTILFTNEMGFASSQRLLGVDFVTDGSVISVQDMILEQQITWIAMDITPLTPLNFNTFFNLNTTGLNPTSKRKTPGDILGPSQSSQSITGTGLLPQLPNSVFEGLGGLGGSPILGPASSTSVV